VRFSPDGSKLAVIAGGELWLLSYPSGGARRISARLSLISPDGGITHELTARWLQASGFSKDGSQVFGIFRGTAGEGAEWQLYSIDVKTRAEKFLAAVDLPASTDGLTGFSLHPDGKRFLTSIAKFPYDIWMLEGFDQRKSLLDRLLRR
jgi:hypothetical protein